MEISKLKKKQLVEIASSRFNLQSLRKLSKVQLIEKIQQHQIPVLVHYNDETSNNLLIGKCQQFPDFVRKVHGKNKLSLLNFIRSKEEEENVYSDALEEKILQCFQSQVPMKFENEFLKNEIRDCLF